MISKKTYSYLFLFFLLNFIVINSKTIFAQSFEIGLTGGFGTYEGDLSPFLFVPTETHPAAGAFFRLNFNRYLAIRTQIMTTKISGSDTNSILDAGRLERNLSFESKIQELSIMPELNLAFFDRRNFLGKFSGFVYGGVALFHFDPYTQFNDEKVRLQPLGTEGQGIEGNPDKYSLTQFSIPMGGGLKVYLNDQWTLSIEGSARKTFTDYLDDVSSSYTDNIDLLISTNGTLAGQLSARNWEYLNAQCNCNDYTPANSYPNSKRGDVFHDDWYLTLGFTISYKFKKFQNLNSFKMKRIVCPTNF